MTEPFPGNPQPDSAGAATSGPPPPFAQTGTAATPAAAPAGVTYEGVPQVNQDQEHLKVLSICWYIASGLAILFGLLPLFYVVIGILFITGAMGGGAAPPPPAVGWIFVIVGSAVSLVIWAGAALGFVAARSLPRRRRIGFCYAAAGLACLQIPIGTCLGVFTFIVLGRPSVRASFD